MATDEGKPEGEEWDEDGDGWEDFRGEDGEPICTSELKDLKLSEMPEDIRIWVMDDYFPDTTIRREGRTLICHIEEHLYTKFWGHKFSAYAFAEAMERAVRRLMREGHPLADPTRDDEDVHIFVRWDLHLPIDTQPVEVVDSINAAFELVYRRADLILENSDSVLILGKDTGEALQRLQDIASKLQELGYYTYIIKEQPDKAGESVVQKVMRYALSSKFIIIENTEPSGHLYEIPHVAKSAECVTVVLQEEGKGATWMFEDAYAKHRHWHKIVYNRDELHSSVEQAAEWAEKFVREFASYQVSKLPWLKPKATDTAADA
jgi:hypothetical protein